jgi:hypothetical protein
MSWTDFLPSGTWTWWGWALRSEEPFRSPFRLCPSPTMQAPPRVLPGRPRRCGGLSQLARSAKTWLTAAHVAPTSPPPPTRTAKVRQLAGRTSCVRSKRTHLNASAETDVSAMTVSSAAGVLASEGISGSTGFGRPCASQHSARYERLRATGGGSLTSLIWKEKRRRRRPGASPNQTSSTLTGLRSFLKTP